MTNETNLADTLCHKAKVNDYESLKLFYKAGVNLNLKNYDNRTVAHIAAVEGHEVLLTFLALEAKFDFTIQDRNGKTPIDEINDQALADKIKKLIVDNTIEVSKDNIEVAV